MLRAVQTNERAADDFALTHLLAGLRSDEHLTASFRPLGSRGRGAGNPQSHVPPTEHPTHVGEETQRPIEALPHRLVTHQTIALLDLPDNASGIIGTGGQAVIYSYVQEELGREVAVKTLRPGYRSLEEIEDLVREACVTAGLEHPGIVPVHYLHLPDHFDDPPYWVMKRIRGESLAMHLPSGNAPWEFRRLLEVYRRLLDAVAFAHSRGVVHCDIKPPNVLVGSFGEMQLTDWGLAVALNPDGPTRPAPPLNDAPAASGNARNTSREELPDSIARLNRAVREGRIGAIPAAQAGGGAGTPIYMAPEQLERTAENVDERTDVFLLGGVLYAMLTGLAPHDIAGDMGETTMQRRYDAIRSCSTIVPPEQRRTSAGLPSRLQGMSSSAMASISAIAMKALSQEKADRYQSVEELGRTLRDWEADAAGTALCAQAEAELVEARTRGRRGAAAYAQAIALAGAALEHQPDNRRAIEIREHAVSSLHAIQVRSARRLWAAVAAVALAFVIGAIGYARTSRQRAAAVAQRSRAEEMTRIVEAQKTRIEDTLETSLRNLLASRFREENYEGVMETAGQIKARFGASALRRSEMMDALRPALWLNGVLGRWQTGLAGADGILSSPRDDTVYIVRGKKVHIFDAMKGSVTGTITLPGDPATSRAVFSRGDSGLWTGIGSQLVHMEAGEIVRSLNIATMAVPPLPEAVDVADESQEREWIERVGRTWPITAVTVCEPKRTAAVVLGDAIVCLLDLQEGESILWWYGFRDGRSYAFRPEPEVLSSLIELSPDGSWMAWRPGRRRHVILLNLSDVRNVFAVQNRDHPIRAIRFREDGSGVWCVTAQGMAFCMQTDPSTYHTRAESYTEYRPNYPLPFSQISVACFDPRGHHFCALTDQGDLLVAPSVPHTSYTVRRRTPHRNWAGGVLNDDGVVTAIADDGELVRYDGRAFGEMAFQHERRYVSLAPGAAPGRFFAVTRRDEETGRAQLVEITVDDRNGELTASDLGTGNLSFKSAEGVPLISATENGTHVAVFAGCRGYIYDLATGDIVHRFPERRCIVSTMAFSRDGRSFCYGAWTGELRVLRVGSWETVFSRDCSRWVYDCRVTQSVGEEARVLFCGEDDTWQTQCHKLFSPEIVWQAPGLGGVPNVMIPWRDGSGEDRYWIGHHWGNYVCLSAADGEMIHEQERWRGLGPEIETTSHGTPFVAFLTHGREIQICLLANIEPLFDPHSIRTRPERIVFNRDGSRLAALDEGRLTLIEAARWRGNPLLRKNLEAHMGSEILPSSVWNESLDSDE